MYKETLRKLSKTKQAAIIGIIAFVTVIIISTFALLKFVSIESRRDLVNWETRIGILADSRANAVNDWVQRQFSELTSLAQNQYLELYVSQVMQSPAESHEEPFQVSYLRNLLVLTAERSGFASKSTQTVNANVQLEGISGIAILDRDKRVLVSTLSMPPLEGRLAEIIANLPQSENYISNIYKGAEGKPSVLFSVPIPSVQGDEDSGRNYVGSIIGIQTVEETLFPLLKQPGATEKTAEVMLVRLEGNIISYLTPVNDGTPALTKNLNSNSELEASFAVLNPGQFDIKRDYAYNKVLVTGRKIPNTPWTLVYKVNSDEALAESTTHRNNLLTIGIITIFFITAAAIAMWQYANFLKESRVAERYRKMMMDLKAQKHILRLITDNKPEVTFIVDVKNRYRFANLKAAQQAGISAKEMIGQSIVNIMGKDKARPYIKMNATALADNKIVNSTQRFYENGEEKIIQSCHIPLIHIPTDDSKSREGVLVIEQDITLPIQSKEKLLRSFDAVIDMILTFMDKRDKYTADHSTRVAKLASEIASEMELDSLLVETVKIAGKLMNLGRMLLPLSVLTKSEGLTKDEKHLFEETPNVSAELLEGIEFEGPVIETIRQAHEHFDGNGTHHLKGDDILITARIVAVADEFVSLRSPRAHRMMKTLDETIQSINNEAGTKFDRKVVAALINYIENRGGRDNWQHPEEITAKKG